jgi:hypothetical protein
VTSASLVVAGIGIAVLLLGLLAGDLLDGVADALHTGEAGGPLTTEAIGAALAAGGAPAALTTYAGVRCRRGRRRGHRRAPLRVAGHPDDQRPRRDGHRPHPAHRRPRRARGDRRHAHPRRRPRRGRRRAGRAAGQARGPRRGPAARRRAGLGQRRRVRDLRARHPPMAVTARGSSSTRRSSCASRTASASTSPPPCSAPASRSTRRCATGARGPAGRSRSWAWAA